MEDKKWIFIEKSMETVRYKVGDSMEDSQEYVLCPTSSSPSSFEMIQTEQEELSAADTLEIYDDHFRCNSSSSCQTSDMEDSDIEVVLKSPSSSETASLCSRNSNKSLPNNDICKYEDMVFNVEIGGGLNSTNEEEDSEVEVIARSIHCDKPIEISHVEEIEENSTGNTRMSMLGSENENDDEIEEVGECFEAEETLCYENECEIGRSREDGEVSFVEPVEDYGIKYLFEDIHVTRQTCNRMNGLKGSTVLLIVCVSATLGLHLGNYFGKSWYEMNQSLDGDEEVVIPDNILHSNKEDPMSVNVTFKYSSSTKETLKSVLLSFRKLKQDYDRLHAAFHDLKEKSHLKRQMTLYWRKQVGKMMEMMDTSMSEQFSAMFNEDKDKENTKGTIENTTSRLHRMEIRKLSSDLNRQRKSAMYWKKMYNKELLSNENTCPKDGHESPSPYFSFSDCFNIFSKVIPKLDITALNITQPVADQVHNAWSKLRNGWNTEQNRNKDHHIDATKVDRFLKIFVIGNVVNSADRDNNYVFNDAETEVDVCDDLDPEHNLTLGKQEELFLSTPANNKLDRNETHQINPNISVSTYTRNHNISMDPHHKLVKHKAGYEHMDELHWLRNKFKESKFLVDILKWQSNYRKKIDMFKRKRTNNLINENKLKSRVLKELYNLERENREVKEKMSNNSAYYENIRRRVKQLKVMDSRQCNVSKMAIKRTLRKKYSYLINKIECKVRKEEQRKSSRKVYYLMDRVKRRYNLLLTETVKSIRRQQKSKFKKKLRKMKKSFKRDNKRGYKSFNLQHEDKDKHDHMNRKSYHDNRHGILITEGVKSLRREEKSTFEKKLHESKNFKRNNKKEYKKLQREDKEKERHGRRNRKRYHDKNRSRRYKHKIRELANKYQRSIVEIAKLRKMYNNAVEETKHEKQIAKDYKAEVERHKAIIKEYRDEVERHKAIIKEYEGKISKLVDSKEARRYTFAKKKVLPGTLRTSTKDASESEEVLHTDVNTKTEDVEEEITLDNSKVRKNIMDTVPTGNCYNDLNGKSFYNINDVYPEDLFSRTPNPSIPTTAFSEPKTVAFLPQQEKNIWHIPHFVDLSAFNGNTMSISGTNNSEGFPPAASQLHYKEDIAIPNNWYVKWMDEKRKHGNTDSFESDVVQKGGIWFWKMMKEREKVRSSEEELNWFWKAMKEREELRTYESEETYFMNLMRNRETSREKNEDV